MLQHGTYQEYIQEVVDVDTLSGEGIQTPLRDGISIVGEIISTLIGDAVQYNFQWKVLKGYGKRICGVLSFYRMEKGEQNKPK
jgi:hypothetical protein